MRYNAFLTHSVVVSFPTKFISIGISNPTPVPLISFAAARQMLDQLQDFASSFADTEMQCQLATTVLLKSCKTWGCNAGNKLRLKTFSLQNFQCSWYIRFVYLYPKNCFFYSLRPILPLLLMDNSQKSYKSKNNAWRTNDLSAGLKSYKNRETCSRRTPV